MVHIGFGVILLFCVIGLIVIGFVAPDVFHEIMQKLEEIIEAITPSILNSLA